MRFNLPIGRVVPVTHIDVRLDASPHPFELAHVDAIDVNWALEHAANPALFDGQMALLSDVSYDDGVLSGRCHSVRYATLLYWRKNRPPNVHHAFAHAVLAARDGTLVAARMGSHTANAGRVYFAAGSFEAEDFVDGVVDVDANMIREVQEETGIDLSQAERDAIHHMVTQNGSTVIFRRYTLALSADEIARRIAAHIAAEVEPELDGPVLIRDRTDVPDGLAGHMQPLIDWHFETLR